MFDKIEPTQNSIGNTMNTTIKLSLLTTLLLSTNLIAEEKLEDITITSATKTEQNLADVTSNINIITAQEIEERHYTTVAEALNSLPGVSFTSNGGLGTTTSLRLRGMASKRVLGLIDGIRYNDITGLNGAPFEHLVLSDIERIEVIKGAESGIWGADASAGVINIITKEAKEGLSFNASQEFGSFGTTKVHAGVSYKTDKFYIKANHTNLDSNSFTAQAPRGKDIDKFEDDAYNNKTTSLKAGFNITSTNKIELSHTIIDANSQYDGFNQPNAENNATTKNSFSSINFNHIDSFNEVNIYAKKSKFERKFISGFGTSPYDGEVKEYGLTSNIPYIKDGFLLVGGDYKKFEHKNSLNKEFTNKALFLTNNNKFKGMIGGTTILTESIRHDSYSDFDNKTTGKIGIKHIHDKINGLSTSANYGTAYNVPTPYNLFDPTSGNKNLTPENTKSWDIGVEYKDLKVTYFDTKIEDMIDYQSKFDADGNWIGGNYQNMSGKSKIKGVEVAYQTTILDDLLISSSYTYTDAKNEKEERLKRVPKENVKLALDYYGVEKLHLGVSGEYVGERYSLDNEQGQQTGKYTIANFTTNYEFDKHLSFYGKVDNITDKYYQTIDGYATSPRAFYAGMKLTY